MRSDYIFHLPGLLPPKTDSHPGAFTMIVKHKMHQMKTIFCALCACVCFCITTILCIMRLCFFVYSIALPLIFFLIKLYCYHAVMKGNAEI